MDKFFYVHKLYIFIIDNNIKDSNRRIRSNYIANKHLRERHTKESVLFTSDKWKPSECVLPTFQVTKNIFYRQIQIWTTFYVKDLQPDLENSQYDLMEIGY